MNIVRANGRRSFVLAAIIAALTLPSCNGGKHMDADKIERTAVTEMQRLMAEKAVKLPAENNPVVAHKYGADPALLVYGDTVYLYTTNDMQQFEFTQGKADNGYDKITTLNVFSSKDLVNWTDCGEISVAGKNGGDGAAKWASNSWAPAVAWKRIGGTDKFFIYFADSGNGIGVLEGDSPTGPFIDPLGAPLVSRAVPGCQKINWLFDPAVIVDEDGSGYLYFGGGHDPDTYEHPMNARAVALSDDMVHLAGEPVVIDAPFLFEDSGINKIGSTWYYTYCTNWQDRKDSKDPDRMPIAVIGYMSSQNPLGPFEYKGYTLENSGTAFGTWGNNHHWIFSFKGKWYIAYHTQTMEKTVGHEKGGYRNVFIDTFAVNADGSLPVQKSTKQGVAQACPFALGGEVPAATFASARNAAVTSRQTVAAVKDGAYLCIKGADLSAGASEFGVKCVPAKDAAIALRIDGMGGKGTEIARLKLGGATACSTKLSLPPDAQGIHDLYIVLPEGCELISWIIK